MSNEQNEQTEKHHSLPYLGVPRLWPYIRQYRGRIVAMVVMGMLCSVIDAVFPLFNRYALDHYVGEKTLDTLLVFILLYIGVLVVQSVLNYFSTFICSKIELWVGRDMKNAVFNHVQTLSFSFFNTNNVGYIHSRIMSDTDRIGTFVSWRLMELAWSLSYIIFIFISMFTLSARLGGLLALLVPFTVLFVIYFQRKLVVLHRNVREINSRITGNFNEGITGARQIKTLVVEDVVQESFEKETSAMKRAAVRATRTNGLFLATVTMMANLALALVLWKGGKLTMEAVIKIGTLSVFMSYAMGMMDSIQEVIGTISALIDVQVNIERVMRVLDTKSDVVDTPEVIEKYGDTFEPKRENFEPLHGDIEFRDVSFQYPDGEELVLENFNLKVPQGTNVAIVGETGAGKSTLVNLVCRFYEPTKGQVLIDGRDARERSQLWLHSNIGYVLQTPHLFSGSVRENLQYGRPGATDEEIIEALKLVSADGVIERLGRAMIEGEANKKPEEETGRRHKKKAAGGYSGNAAQEQSAGKAAAKAAGGNPENAAAQEQSAEKAAKAAENNSGNAAAQEQSAGKAAKKAAENNSGNAAKEQSAGKAAEKAAGGNPENAAVQDHNAGKPAVKAVENNSGNTVQDQSAGRAAERDAGGNPENAAVQDHNAGKPAVDREITPQEAMIKGLSADVGEGGDLLSTGEKQLLSFARAILTDPAILVLDEATSSIDTVTEKAIQDAIQTVTRGRTSFMIAHRLSTVVDADVILVVLDGKIIESGRHAELMAMRGYYYQLFTRQYEDAATQQAL